MCLRDGLTTGGRARGSSGERRRIVCGGSRWRAVDDRPGVGLAFLSNRAAAARTHPFDGRRAEPDRQALCRNLVTDYIALEPARAAFVRPWTRHRILADRCLGDDG